MKLTKCVNGHFYDEEKFESCPHCAGGSKLDVNAIFGGTPSAPKPAMSKVESDDDVTVPLEWTPEEPAAPEMPAAEAVPEPPVEAAPEPAFESIPEEPEPMAEAVPEIPVAEPAAEAEPETPVAKPAAEAVPETPVAEPEAEIIPEEPAFEPISETAGSVGEAEPEIPAFEPIPETVPEESEVTAAEEKIEETSDMSVDIQSQPSFDTPLDFDGEFTEGIKAAEPEPSAEPEEEFELLSKFDSNQADTEESEVTAEAEPFVLPKTDASESFAALESEPAAEPEPFVVPEPTAESVSEPEPFAESEPASESGLFVTPEAAKAEWEIPQPNVEEIPTENGITGMADPELEDKPTEIVDENDLANEMNTDAGPFVPLEPTTAPIPEAAPTAEAPVSAMPSPAAAMFGGSADDDDDEHTVAFYDEIFVSTAPSAPVVPEAAAPIPEAVPVSETAAEPQGDTVGTPEPEVFTAPPLQPAQALPTPCVGWLIALNGSHIGQDFHLRVGKNYIGRDVGMDIALTGDKSVSRNKHAIVIYEPKHHKYFIQPGESNELVYVNDEVVLLPMPLKPYDVIVIGDIELWFIPLCDDQHNWSEVIRRLQEQM